MKKLSLLLVLMYAFSSFANTEINIVSSIDVPDYADISFTAPFDKKIDSYLDLGVDISNTKLFIDSEENANYRVHIQLETSMAIGDEGPHLDLSDWKHCTTEWLSVKPLDKVSFVLPDISSIKTDCFPQLSMDEIKAEVLKRGGQRWLNVLERNIGSDYYDPTYIALSAIRIKIEKQVNSQWQEVTVINFNVPMGC